MKSPGDKVGVSGYPDFVEQRVVVAGAVTANHAEGCGDTGPALQTDTELLGEVFDRSGTSLDGFPDLFVSDPRTEAYVHCFKPWNWSVRGILRK